MKAAISVNHMIHQQSHGAAIKAGLEVHGIECEFTDGDRVDVTADFHVTWGAEHKRPRIFEWSAENNLPVLVMERAYLPDRLEYTSMGWNGLNNRATFPECRDDGARFRSHWPNLLKPWRTIGERGYVLICGQVPGDASVKNVNLAEWAQTVVDIAWDDLLFRPHPVLIERKATIRRPKGVKISTAETLEEDLAGAKLCVTYNSNSGVEAVLAGVPTVAFDEGSMAWPMACHGALNALRPNRDEWAHNLAFSQWTLDEIANGTAWYFVKDVQEPLKREVAA